MNLAALTYGDRPPLRRRKCRGWASLLPGWSAVSALSKISRAGNAVGDDRTLLVAPSRWICASIRSASSRASFSTERNESDSGWSASATDRVKRTVCKAMRRNISQSQSYRLMLPRYCTWVTCRLQKLPPRDRGHFGFPHCSRVGFTIATTLQTMLPASLSARVCRARMASTVSATSSRAGRALRPKRVVRSRGPRNRPSGSTPAGSGRPLSGALRRRRASAVAPY